MESGLPELYAVDGNGGIRITSAGSAIKGNNNFRYLDFLRHQINEQLNKAYKEERDCEDTLRDISREYEKTLQDIYKQVGRGLSPDDINQVARDRTGWPKHPTYLYWDQPYQKRILNNVKILEASRDLVVGQMNEIGSRG